MIGFNSILLIFYVFIFVLYTLLQLVQWESKRPKVSKDCGWLIFPILDGEHLFNLSLTVSLSLSSVFHRPNALFLSGTPTYSMFPHMSVILSFKFGFIHIFQILESFISVSIKARLLFKRCCQGRKAISPGQGGGGRGV